jgi:hypothetical protein
LAEGESYYINLVYDDRIVDTSDPSITKTQFYDIGTEVDFATAPGVVPEPSTWAMLLVGFGGIGFTSRRWLRGQGGLNRRFRLWAAAGGAGGPSRQCE